MGLLLRRRTAWSGRGTERLLVLDEGRRDLGLLVSEVLLIANLGSSEPEQEPYPEPVERFTKESLVEKIGSLFGP
jgi:hypothetical protein